MSRFQDLSIRSKVMAAFGTVLAVTVLLGVFSINRLSIVNDGAVTVSNNYLVAANGLSDIGANVMRLAVTITAAIEDQGAATEAANSAGTVANKVLSSARTLFHQASEMRDLEQNFLTQVKAA
jgi:hypothetical protein